MKKIGLLVLALCLSLSVSLPVYAQAPYTQSHIQPLKNGDYFETTITVFPQPFSAKTTRSGNKTIRSGNKTTTYRNGSGNAMWSITVHATFSYTYGGSCTCTSANGSATSYSSIWKVSTPSTSRNGNRATTTATGKLYVGSTAIDILTQSVTLSCDSYGNLS